MNEYFQPASVPAPNSPGSSAAIRAEFASIAAAFDKLPIMAGSANEFVMVNAAGTALIAAGFGANDVISTNSSQTLTNKTINWSDNSISTIPIAGGGTGATDLSGAQAALGINLKADANNAVLTGAPTAPTPPAGNSSSRLATTQFVQDTVVIAGGVVPSNVPPAMNGVASAGVGGQVSREDHVHPVDTSRAPASAGTAAGTSFTPDAGIAATNVQAAIVELVSDIGTAISGFAPLASPAFTGSPTAPTPATSDNDTSVATTAFVQSLLAQQPPGIGPSDDAPTMNGVAAPGTSVDASRSDHVHPVDTSRAPSSASTAAGTSFTPAGGIAATNVQAAIAELDSEKAPSSAGTASGTSFTPAGGIAATNVQAAIAELDTEKAPASAGTATGTSFTPSGPITSTNVQAAISEVATLSAGVPVGAVFDFPASSAPTGFVKCNGALLSRTAYAALWAYAQASGNISATDGAWVAGKFSPGDGSTTFRIPDLRGEFRRGWDDGRGIDSGRAIGTAQDHALFSHTHTGSTSSAGSHQHSGVAGGVGDALAIGYSSAIGMTGVAGDHTHALIINSTGGSETRPRNVALLACIKY